MVNSVRDLPYSQETYENSHCLSRNYWLLKVFLVLETQEHNMPRASIQCWLFYSSFFFVSFLFFVRFKGSWHPKQHISATSLFYSSRESICSWRQCTSRSMHGATEQIPGPTPCTGNQVHLFKLAVSFISGGTLIFQSSVHPSVQNGQISNRSTTQ